MSETVEIDSWQYETLRNDLNRIERVLIGICGLLQPQVAPATPMPSDEAIEEAVALIESKSDNKRTIEWKPIEDYDYDKGYRVLLADAEGYIGDGVCFTNGTWFEVNGGLLYPTHYAELPEGPKENTK